MPSAVSFSSPFSRKWYVSHTFRCCNFPLLRRLYSSVLICPYSKQSTEDTSYLPLTCLLCIHVQVPLSFWDSCIFSFCRSCRLQNCRIAIANNQTFAVCMYISPAVNVRAYLYILSAHIPPIYNHTPPNMRLRICKGKERSDYKPDAVRGR